MRRSILFARTVAQVSRRPRRFRPSPLGLESRELLATAIASLHSTPSALSPSGKLVTVEISGSLIETRKDVTPDVRYYVSDEYRRHEPRGKVQLTPIPGATAWTFKFPLVFEAKRANSDTSGRQYAVTIGTSDQDNAQGQTVPVLVLHTPLKPGQVPRSTAEHPTKKQLKRLPPVNIPMKSSSGLPSFSNLFGNTGKKK